MTRDDASLRSIMVMMMMMVVMVMASGSDHNPRGPAIGVMVVMMMVVTPHHDKLRQFNVRWRHGSGFIDRLQQRRGVRDRLQQVGEGTRPQHVARCRTRSGLSGIECSERRRRSQKSSDLLVHRFSSSDVSPSTLPAVGNAGIGRWFRW
jgi:hypothetical protein